MMGKGVVCGTLKTYQHSMDLSSEHLDAEMT